VGGLSFLFIDCRVSLANNHLRIGHVCELDLERPISVCRPMPNFCQETSALMSAWACLLNEPAGCPKLE
jgi:hypothetical protein